MQHALLLVIALAGSDWNCTETDGLWDCRSAQPTARAPTPAAAPTTLATPLVAGQTSLPPAPAAGPTEAPAPAPTETPAAVPVEAPADVPAEAPPAAPVEATATIPMEDPALNEAPESESAQPTPGLKPQKAFVVQVGAYRERADAEQVASQLDYETLAIVPTEREGESWWVIVLGTFRTLEAARSVGDEYEAETGGSYWVRTADDLQAVLAYPE